MVRNDQIQAADALERRDGENQFQIFAWHEAASCGDRCGNPHVKVQIKGVRGFKGGRLAVTFRTVPPDDPASGPENGG